MGMGDDSKSSAHVWGAQQEMAIDDSPPAYSGLVLEPAQPPDLPGRPRRKPVPREAYHPVLSIAQWAKIPWAKYVVPDAVVSADRTTITTTSATFLSSQQALIKLIGEQADLPPIPSLRITGNHILSTTYQPKVDFDLTINLSGLLDLSRTPRWHNKPAQVVPLPGPDGKSPATASVTGNNTVQIENFARQFLKDKSDRKSFVLSRTIENLPIDIIEGLVRNLIASLHYRGKITVSFPIQCGQLIVQKKPGGTSAAVGGWFMNVLGLSPDVKYETLERVWSIGSPILPGAVVDADDSSNGEGGSSGENDTSFLIKDWWNAWAPVVRDSILLQRQGRVGIEDWMETQMGWRPTAKTQDWGVGYGT